MDECPECEHPEHIKQQIEGDGVKQNEQQDCPRQSQVFDEAIEILTHGGPTAYSISQLKAKAQCRKERGQHGGHFTIFGQTFYYGTHRSNSKKNKRKNAEWLAEFQAEMKSK